MIKNILITGCNGQLGNEMQLQAKLYNQYNFIFTDIDELDITDSEKINKFVDDNSIDCIVNCAAYTAVDKAEDNEELCNLLNNLSPGYLANAINRRGGSMIQISTDYVFDGTNHIPYTEEDPTSPNSVYGRTKLAGELNVQKECSNSMIIRTAWLYSSFGNNFVKTMIRLGKERNELGVIFDQIGTPTYARDLACVIMTAIKNGIKPGTYHFSNEGVISWYDFTKAIHRIAGISTCNVKPLHTNEYPAKAPRPAYSVLDKTKIKKTYNITVPYWEDSLKDCINILG
ncbi:MAG: dTDP-4-dehydrorhamnose reductase [Bacteroidaceae bacterium]|nr:dTDP-4-dehydrorhamnose reductase [Bacteroidaceae bacterium]